MATPNSPSLSPEAIHPSDVDFHKLRLYIEEHFRALPDSMQLLSQHLEPASICPYYLTHRICPSLFSDHICQATYHPEFVLRDGYIQWLPRTWICRALQRHLSNPHTAQCPIPHCFYSHAGNWAAAEQLAFRALALRTQAHNMGLLWYEQPEDSGLHPLYQTSSPTALRVVQAQPFITLEQWSNHRYNRDIPSPPTYGPEPSDVRIIQRTQHLRRSTTPRRNRSPTPVRREHQHRPQQLVPETARDITPPRRDVEQPSSSNRAHSTTRNKIGHKAAPPQPPAHYIPRTESLPQRHFHGIDPFEEDSDGLETPPADLQISRPVPKAQLPQPTDYQLLPQLRTLVNIQNYQPRAITGEDSSYFIGEIPAPYMQHLYPSAPGELSPTNNRRTTWQLPSDILHQLNSANIQHPTNITHRSMTPWGLFTRMQMHTPTGQCTHTEQALTIPFATQTASPELAIIQWLFHQRITHDRQAATQDFLTELQRNQDIVPASYFNAVARDWITTAADLYRITTNRQMTPARATMRNMAQTILTTINDNTTPRDRHMVSDPNIGLNSTGELYFI